ncbi:dihydroflavonol 4-reductase-like isoform X2 [Malania oleifera]|uniref:dihydroflavonol 4-reductase-like isoform X2 n=1 Tax=Malania oleifera TaxID=397392 RepID=UPI0025AE948E|nr:dihydroflavonol 4-reductase-like isoform X2 [Malania oleifera]
MERKNSRRVCVTGGSGYIGSFLVKKLLEKGFTVHATLRNLEDEKKVGILKSLPHAETNLVLFQADIYNPTQFEAAIKHCHSVFHVATPLLHIPSPTSQYKNTVEAAIGGVQGIAECCIRSQSVKRLIYTASVVAASPLKEDGSGFKPSMDESCWSPLSLPFNHSNDHLLGYVRSKTLAEQEILSYNNEKEAGNELEVVSLVCGLVGGLLGAVPLVHIEDVCEAHIFCMEKPYLKGRFICAVANPTITDIAAQFQENFPDLEIAGEFMQERMEKGTICDSTKLMKIGFEYQYDVKKIIKDSVECGRRLGAINIPTNKVTSSE